MKNLEDTLISLTPKNGYNEKLISFTNNFNYRFQLDWIFVAIFSSNIFMVFKIATVYK